MKKRASITHFGQQTDHTCSVACISYVLWCYGVNHTEEQLIDRFIEERESGNTAAELAEAVDKIGFVPCVRCLEGYSDLLGKLRNEWVQEGNETELEEWLRQCVEGQKPVIISLDTRYLQPPYDQIWGSLHSIVVIDIREDVATFLDPDPPQQESYPKQAQYMSVNFEILKKAWKLVGCIAILIMRNPGES